MPGSQVIYLPVLCQMGKRTAMLKPGRSKLLACRWAGPLRLMCQSSWLCAETFPILDFGMLPARAFRNVFKYAAVATRRAHHEDLLVG